MANRKDSKGRNLKQGESQRSDGRYMYRYMDVEGKRKTIYSMDLAELREKEKQIQRDLDDNIDTSNAQKTLNQQIQDYIATKPKIAGSTRANYVYIWEKDIKNSALGKKKLENIVKSDIKRFYAELSEKGYRSGTISLYQNLLYPAFQLAVDDNIIRINPCKDCMKEYKKNDAVKKEALTEGQQEKLLEFMKQSTRYKVHAPMVAVMLGTACRIGETIGLTWKDVDLKAKKIDINHQLTYKKIDGVTEFRLTTPKTEDGKRILPMTEEVYQAFLEQRKIQFMFGIPRNVEVAGISGFVFTTMGGRPIQPNCVNRFLDSVVRAYNREETAKAKEERRDPELLPHISAHMLRHTGCTRMAEKGMKPKTLQYIMGHANISVTMDIYAHIDENKVFEEVQALESAAKVI